MRIVFLLLCFGVSLSASEFRTWSQAASGRTLEAKMTDRKKDYSEAKVVTRAGKVHWLKAIDLVKEDRDYILKWEPEIDHLSVRTIGTRKGQKTIEITAEAGNDEIAIHVYYSSEGGVSHIERIKPHSNWKGEQVVSSKYRVVARDQKGKILDEASWNRKGGL